MDGKATHADMDRYDFEWLLNLNEAIDVWQDMHDHEVRPPIVAPPGFTGVSTVRIRGL